MAELSWMERIAAYSVEDRRAIFASLHPRDAERLPYEWEAWARPNQLPPKSNWSKWLLLAGRGFGKTRSGAECIRAMKDRVGRLALVAPTAADARDVMAEGESGLLAIAPPWDRPTYEPSKRRVTWDNGA